MEHKPSSPPSARNDRCAGLLVAGHQTVQWCSDRHAEHDGKCSPHRNRHLLSEGIQSTHIQNSLCEAKLTMEKMNKDTTELDDITKHIEKLCNLLFEESLMISLLPYFSIEPVEISIALYIYLL